MVAPYVVHALPGRVRLRHPCLATEDGQTRVREVLTKVKGVREFQPGFQSLLIFFSPECSVESICAALEDSIPDFAEYRAEGEHNEQTAEKQKNSPVIFGVSPRRAESRLLLACMGASAALGFFGSGTAHVVASALFGAMTLRHVWTRRKSL